MDKEIQYVTDKLEAIAEEMAGIYKGLNKGPEPTDMKARVEKQVKLTSLNQSHEHVNKAVFYLNKIKAL
jgi:hypothetical protein